MTEKNFFEKTLEKKVKGAENLLDSISLETSGNPSIIIYDWKRDGRYDWKANFPYSPPKEGGIRRYIVVKILKKYSSL